MPDPVNLANVNLSLAQFQAVSNGKYNAGEVRLAGENALEQINNHVHSTGKNRVEVSHKEVLAIKEAFVRALSQNGVTADEIRRVRAELGLAAENPRDLSLADRNIKPLSRQQIREILDRNAATLNAAQQDVRIETDAELHAGYRPSKQQKLAAKRDATNAALGATRKERYAKSVAVTMSVIGGDVDFFSRDDRRLLKEEALLQKARILERSNGNPSDEPDAGFTFTPADGPALELKLGMSERDYLKKLDVLIMRLGLGVGPTDDEILVRRAFRKLETREARRNWINSLPNDNTGANSARIAIVSFLGDRGIADYRTLSVANRLSDADAVAFLRVLVDLEDNVAGDALRQEPRVGNYLMRPTLDRPEGSFNAYVPVVQDYEYNGFIFSNLKYDLALVPCEFAKVVTDCYADLRARFGDDGIPAAKTVQKFASDFAMPANILPHTPGAVRSTPDELRNRFVPDQTDRVVRRFVTRACERRLIALGDPKREASNVVNALFAAVPDLKERLMAAPSLEQARNILQEASEALDACIVRNRALVAARQAVEGWAVDELVRQLGIPRESIRPDTLTLNRLTTVSNNLKNDIISGGKKIGDNAEIEGLFRDLARKFAQERADALDAIDKIDAHALSPVAKDEMKRLLLRTEKTKNFKFERILAAAAQIDVAPLAALLRSGAPSAQIAQRMFAVSRAAAAKVGDAIGGGDVGPDERASIGEAILRAAVDRIPGLRDDIAAFYDRPDVGHEPIDYQSPLNGANAFHPFLRDPEANATLAASLGRPTMEPLFVRALADACRDEGIDGLSVADALALFAPDAPAGATLAEAVRATGSAVEITPTLLRSLARSAIRPLAAQVRTVRDATAAFLGGPLAARARALGFAESELPGLARAYALHRAATNCTEEQAFAAVTTPGNPAFRLVRADGRFLESVDNYRNGLRLSEAYDGWYAKVAADLRAGKKNTPTLLNGVHTSVKPQSGAGFAKFLFDEIALNPDIDLEKEDPEEVFGAANNPAMRHLCRHFGSSCYNTLAIVPPAARHLMYRLMDVLCPLGANEQEATAFAWGTTDSPIFVARVLRRLEQAEALFADDRTPTRNQVLDLLFPDVPAAKRGTNHALNRHFSDFVYDQFKQKVITQGGMLAINGLLTNTGCTLDEALDAHLSGKTIPYAPYVTEANDYIEGVVSSAAGLAQLKRDLVRPQRPNLVASGQPAISPENNRFRFQFPDGTTLVAKHGQETNPEVAASHAAIADKIAQLVGAVHPEQLGAVYSAATQAATAPLLTAAAGLGLSVNEHVALTFTLAKDAQSGTVTVTYSEPVGCPVKFHWTTTIAIDGSTVTTPLVVEEAAAQ